MALRPDPALQALLKGVSRSFYLSMKVLPAPVQGPIALGYLLARAADTIADTEAAPGPRRRELLALLLDGVRGAARPAQVQAALDAQGAAPGSASHAEQHLLRRVADCLRLLQGLAEDDRERLRRVLGQLVYGMDTDLQRFPTGPVGPDEVVALPDQAALDDYTYYAAGCVGEFWTAVTAAHVPQVAHLLAPALLARGVALGKCLQLVNVVRDVAADLRAGRCYWPSDALALVGLRPRDLGALAQPGAAPPDEAQAAALRVVTRRLVRQAQDLGAQSWGYVQAIPARALRLRLACTWPLLLGLRTLAEIGRRGSPLLGEARVIKVTRARVYALVAESSAAALWDAAAGRDRGGALDLLETSYALTSRAAQT